MTLAMAVLEASCMYAPTCTRVVVNSYWASLSEPHIDEFAVNFLYISVVRRAVSHFLLLFCVCQTYISLWYVVP